MTLREFSWVGMVCCLVALGMEARGAAATALAPNVIFILADDLGYGDLGCYGQRRILTPHLDRLAAGGMRFTQAYAGSTVCAPSRAVLMTGQHTGRTLIRGNARLPLRPGDETVAEVMRKGGLATGLVGKWGLGEEGSSGTPNKKGFDFFYGYLNQHHAHNYYPTYLWRDGGRVALRNVVPEEDAMGGGVASVRVDYSADLFAAEALEFVRARREERFFLYLALTTPHANNEAGREGMEVPSLGEYEGRPWPGSQRAHAAMISRMDADIGRLLGLLKELGLEGRTLVVFTSDNGPHREGGNDPKFNDSSGGLRGIKRDLYEGGIRVPFIARWPGVVPAGAVCHSPIHFMDVLPTLAELAGVPPAGPVDGVSLLPTLRGEAQPGLESRPLYWEFHEGGFKQAARRGNWKVARTGLGRGLELYDLAADPGEKLDMAAEHPAVVAGFEKYLAGARTESEHWPVRGRIGRP